MSTAENEHIIFLGLMTLNRMLLCSFSNFG